VYQAFDLDGLEWCFFPASSQLHVWASRKGRAELTLPLSNPFYGSKPVELLLVLEALLFLERQPHAANFVWLPSGNRALVN
jgi:hypothetical protein